MKNQTCCFTGHRKINEEERKEIQKRLITEIRKLINKGVTYFGCGGAKGFDTIAALSIIQLKIEFPQIKLIMVLPCKNQTDGWDVSDIKIYYFILKYADKVIYTSIKSSRGCMHKRNRHLVDNSGTCICYLKEQKGGTAYTVKYAKAQNLNVINIANLCESVSNQPI